MFELTYPKLTLFGAGDFSIYLGGGVRSGPPQPKLENVHHMMDVLGQSKKNSATFVFMAM